MKNQKMTLYNLFPKYYPNMSFWKEQFVHIKKLGFNTVYINPIHYSGLSGSIYAPKDYFSINPLFIDTEDSASPIMQFQCIIEKAHELGLKLIADLVINHSSIDHPLILEHPEWYLKDKNNQIVHPGTWEDGQWISWGDLAQFDHLNSPTKDLLWEYFSDIIMYYIDLNVDGFRADSAYQIPLELWDFLIQKAKSVKSDVCFIAENLGCRIEDSKNLAESHFDYLYNSAKWWDFKKSWFPEQYNSLANKASIAFPESHDTPRIAAEKNNDRLEIQKKLLFTGLISSAWMILTGTEFGWHKKPDVVNTNPMDQESTQLDLQEFICKINTLRDQYPLLNSEGNIFLKNPDFTEEVLIIEKVWPDSQNIMYFILNNTDHILQLPKIVDFTNTTELISSHEGIAKLQNNSLLPREYKVFYDG